MSYQVEISGSPFSPEQRDELLHLMVTHVGIEPEVAELNLLFTPCVVGPMDARTRNRLLGALDAAGFDADTASSATPAGPLPVSERDSPKAEPEVPALVSSDDSAMRSELEPPTDESPRESFRSVLIAVVVALAVVMAGLGALALSASRNGEHEELPASSLPTVSGGETVPWAVPDESIDEPVQLPDAAEYDRGYSVQRGVNWDVYASEERVRTAAAPNGTPVPIRDAPSARNGDAVGEVVYGGQVRTIGCLPRRDDGGRWCQLPSNEGWIYDRFLQDGIVSAVPRDEEAEYALGFSPYSGVNWDVFSRTNQVRMARAPGGRSIPVRDAPSARHGHAVSEVRPGSTVRTDGCLVRRDDGGHWCRVADGSGWVYDRFLSSTPSAAPSQPSGPTTTSPAYVVMGSYLSNDDVGLRARYDQAQLAGVPLETGRSESYGMKPGYIVIVSGPYERPRADLVLEQVRPYILDAFLRAVR